MSEIIVWSDWIPTKDSIVPDVIRRTICHIRTRDGYESKCSRVAYGWDWHDVTHYRIPMSDYKRITGMPEWSEAPEWAMYLCQDADGQWKFTDTIPRHEHSHGGSFWVGETHKQAGLPGTVLGDWRDTLQERPAGNRLPTAKELADSLKSMAVASRVAGGSLDTHPNSEPDADQCEGAVSMADQYPAYYKDVSGVSAVDVYAVHQLFGVDDPSGCIHHASKKLLLSGVRTGGKSKRDDIREARDTLTRWLDLNHE